MKLDYIGVMYMEPTKSPPLDEAAIRAYLASTDSHDIKQEKGRLVVAGDHLEFRPLKTHEAMRALLGFGPAAFSNVIKFCTDETKHIKISDSDKNTLRNKIETYNSTHFFIKKISDRDIKFLFGEGRGEQKGKGAIASTHKPDAGEITYVKGEKRTKELIPTEKEPLARGSKGVVHVHRDDSKLVVKKMGGKEEIRDEYLIGAKLDHPNIVKTRKLFIKKYPDKTKYKLVMDRINGTPLTSFYHNSVKKLSKEEANSLLSQAKECCLYLFDQKVGWGDVNDENVIVTSDESHPEKRNLKLIDFEYWKTIEDPQERALQLLLGSMEIAGWIVKSSFLRAHPDLVNRDREQAIIFPKEFFGCKINLSQILSTRGTGFYSKEKWMINLKNKISNMNENEIRDLLASYFSSINLDLKM